MFSAPKLAAATLAIGFAVAPAKAQNFHEACAYDISYHCAEVEPGDGRIAACLYAHTATLTDGCYAATDGVARVMEGFFDRLEALKAACTADVEALCGSEKVGDGGVLKCLAASDKLSDACGSGLSKAGVILGE